MEKRTDQRAAIGPGMGIIVLSFVLLFGVILAGVNALKGKSTKGWEPSGLYTQVAGTPGNGGLVEIDPQATQIVDRAIQTPTADLPHSLPKQRTLVEQYTVRTGDTLNKIARKYSVSVNQIIQANNLADPNHVEVGQTLTIPLPLEANRGPAFKIIPDSELVYGPASVGFDIRQFVNSYLGYLRSYQEEVDGKMLDGAAIVERVAQDYSVNPRLLLALLEYQGGWLTQPNPPEKALKYPLGVVEPTRKSLYRQLTWTADNLNLGYYLWRVNGVATWLLADGEAVPIAPTINAGTAAIQQFFAWLEGRSDWMKAVTQDGLIATYTTLFGYPFNRTYEPLLPTGLSQPALQLPFEIGKIWAFTGGPHGGWGDGSAWAALDFAPPSDVLGCVTSDEWVVAVADGMIIRTGLGSVVQDLDGDGLEQTGWAVLYMHVEGRDRVEPGVYLKAGDRIGHPSCEGGVSSGTHLHLARKYNGEWIAADQDIPFNLDGWVSSGDGYVYDGYLTRDDKSVVAYAGRSEVNDIQR